jgi:hypothetical protein
MLALIDQLTLKVLRREAASKLPKMSLAVALADMTVAWRRHAQSE